MPILMMGSLLSGLRCPWRASKITRRGTGSGSCVGRPGLAAMCSGSRSLGGGLRFGLLGLKSRLLGIIL